jgi:hypothetical protein
MAELKTRPGEQDVDAFLDRVEPAQRAQDGRALRDMMERLSGKPATMWGPSIIGFGRYHYRYDSGHEGEMCRIGFSPRKAELVIYLMQGFTGQDDLLARLGKHRRGASCLYIRKLGDVDIEILEQLLAGALELMASRYPESDI